MKGWFRRTLEAQLNTVIGVGLVAAVVAAAAAIWKLGGETVEGWVIVLIVAALLGVIATLVALFVRVSRLAQAQIGPVRPRHAGLIARLDALDAQIAPLLQSNAAAWSVAEAFNGILEEAMVATLMISVHVMPLLTQHEYMRAHADCDVGDVRVVIGQLRAMLEHDDGPRPSYRRGAQRKTE